MANFDYEHMTNANGFHYGIFNLSSPWSGGDYTMMGIATQPFVSGVQTFSSYYFEIYDTCPAGYAKVYGFGVAPVPSDAYYSSSYYLTSSSITVYPFVVTTPGLMWGVTSSYSVPQGQTVPGILLTVPSAPTSFYWKNYGSGYSPQNTNGVFYIPYASAWNALRDFIISKLVSTGKILSANSFYGSSYYYPSVTSGSDILADDYNQAAFAINSMYGYSGIGYVYALSTPLTERYFYLLEYYVNLI